MVSDTLEQQYHPDTYVIDPAQPAASLDVKGPRAVDQYPNISDYDRVPFDRYVSREFMEREWNSMWTKVWTYAGHISDLKIPGDFIRYDLGRQSFLIVRTDKNTIRAFHNVCQHRGRQLVDAPFGNRQVFVCGNHSWAYNIDGSNARVTYSEMFSDGALCGSVNLPEIRCETFAGLVFVNMDPLAPSLMDFLGDLPERMAVYHLEDMYIVKDVIVPLDCNWKTGIDMFNEGYHAHMTHPQAAPTFDDYNVQFDFYRNGHSRFVSKVGVPPPRLSDRPTLRPGMKALLADAGIDPSTFAGTAMDVRAAIVESKRQSNNHFGLDYSRFTDSQLTDAWNYYVFPNVTFNTHPEGLLVQLFLPHATDPEKFYYHIQVLVNRLKDGALPPSFMGLEPGTDISGNTRPPLIYGTAEDPKVGKFLEQDICNIEAVQRGMHSEGFTSLRLSAHEMRLKTMHAEIDRYINGQK